MIRFALILYTCFLIPYTCLSQSLDPKRTVNWTSVGMSESRISPPTVINFLEAGGINDGHTPNDIIFQQILDAYVGVPMVLYMPTGIYHFTQALELPNHFILRGAGADSSILQFDLSHPAHLIQVQGQSSLDTSALIQDVHSGENMLILARSKGFREGDYVQLVDEDQPYITSDWAKQSTGHLARIEQVSGDTLFLNQAVRRDFLLSDTARAVRFTPKTQVGIEQLQIVRLDQTEEQTSNVFFEYAADCWISCIDSRSCNFAHLEISRSTQIEVQGSHFERAFSYGNGGKAYGVMLHFATGSCLIQDNSFRTLRHAMILQAGANGNVLAYNYSTHPHWTGVFLPSNSAGDLVLHGNYPYANLFESNVVQNIVIDNSHGINGPYNTFFRNRAELYGVFMNSNPASSRQNFIGNEIPNTDQFHGNFLLAGSDHFEQANNVQGIISPVEKNSLLEVSLYTEDSSFTPVIGYPNALNAQTIEAQKRTEDGFMTTCSVPAITTSNEKHLRSDSNFQVFPNPGKDRIEVQFGQEEFKRLMRVEVCNLAGQVLLFSNGHLLDIHHLPHGMYLVRILMEDGEIFSRKWVKA